MSSPHPADPALAPPTRADVEARLAAVLEGRLTRDEADRWATPWVPNGAHLVDDPVVRTALRRIMGIDLVDPTDGYLHDDEQIRDWLRDVHAGRWRRREELIALVERIRTNDFSSDAELEEAVATFEASVPRPGVADLIFHYEDEFGREPTAGEIVDQALSYRAIAL